MILVYTLCGSPDEAKTLATHLISENIAARVNVFPAVISVYREEDDIKQIMEIPLLIKARNTQKEHVITAIKKLHSYAVPVILSWPAESMNADYTQWMKQNLK